MSRSNSGTLPNPTISSRSVLFDLIKDWRWPCPLLRCYSTDWSFLMIRAEVHSISTVTPEVLAAKCWMNSRFDCELSLPIRRRVAQSYEIGPGRAGGFIFVDLLSLG